MITDVKMVEKQLCSSECIKGRYIVNMTIEDVLYASIKQRTFSFGKFLLRRSQEC